MSSFRPRLMTGHIVPGAVDPNVVFGGFRFDNNEVIPPITYPTKPPVTLGDDRHVELLRALKGIQIMISQQAKQSVGSGILKEDRIWKG